MDPARSVLEAAAGRAGLDAAGAELVRTGATSLFRLPATGWLARVGPHEAPANREVTVAAVLALAGVPAVRLAPVGRQPLVARGGVVTVWEDAEPTGAEPDPASIGRLARRLHDATAGLPDLAALAPLDPPAASAERIRQAGEAGSVPAEDLAVLWAAHARLAAAWAARAPAHRPVLVHGDLHRGNVLVTRDGLVLADLELAGAGDPAYDLAPALVATRRYGRPMGDHEAFAAAYGRDLRDDPDVDLLCAVYELWVTAWAAAAAAADPALTGEARLRIGTIRGDAGTPPWTLY